MKTQIIRYHGIAFIADENGKVIGDIDEKLKNVLENQKIRNMDTVEKEVELNYYHRTFTSINQVLFIIPKENSTYQMGFNNGVIVDNIPKETGEYLLKQVQNER